MKKLLFFLLFISCTVEDIDEDNCVKISKQCIVGRDKIKTCYYECYK